VSYALVRSTNLSSAAWQLVWQGTNIPTGGIARVTVPAGTNGLAFYRLVPPVPAPWDTLQPIALDFASRHGTELRFEFYSRGAPSYQAQWLPELPHDPLPMESGQWQTIQSIIAPAGTLVTVIDAKATNAAGYYRMENPPR
jgi:hypothetical protein